MEVKKWLLQEMDALVPLSKILISSFPPLITGGKEEVLSSSKYVRVLKAGYYCNPLSTDASQNAKSMITYIIYNQHVYST